MAKVIQLLLYPTQTFKVLTIICFLFFIEGTKEVFIAGNDPKAKDQVRELIHYLGFTPIDRGSLQNSKGIEDVPVQRFPNWKYPLIVSGIVFLWFFSIGFGKYQICLTWPMPLQVG